MLQLCEAVLTQIGAHRGAGLEQDRGANLGPGPCLIRALCRALRVIRELGLPRGPGRGRYHGP